MAPFGEVPGLAEALLVGAPALAAPIAVVGVRRTVGALAGVPAETAPLALLAAAHGALAGGVLAVSMPLVHACRDLSDRPGVAADVAAAASGAALAAVVAAAAGLGALLRVDVRAGAEVTRGRPGVAAGLAAAGVYAGLRLAGVHGESLVAPQAHAIGAGLAVAALAAGGRRGAWAALRSGVGAEAPPEPAAAAWLAGAAGAAGAGLAVALYGQLGVALHLDDVREVGHGLVSAVLGPVYGVSAAVACVLAAAHAAARRSAVVAEALVGTALPATLAVVLLAGLSAPLAVALVRATLG